MCLILYRTLCERFCSKKLTLSYNVLTQSRWTQNHITHLKMHYFFNVYFLSSYKLCSTRVLIHPKHVDLKAHRLHLGLDIEFIYLLLIGCQYDTTELIIHCNTYLHFKLVNKQGLWGSLMQKKGNFRHFLFCKAMRNQLHRFPLSYA